MDIITGMVPELKYGDKDPLNGWYYVGRLQKLLNITADGDYGPATAAAVKAYNLKELSRTTDGHAVDGAFWTRLYGLQKVVVTKPVPHPPPPHPTPTPVPPEVTELQNRVTENESAITRIKAAILAMQRQIQKLILGQN